VGTQNEPDFLKKTQRQPGANVEPPGDSNGDTNCDTRIPPTHPEYPHAGDLFRVTPHRPIGIDSWPVEDE
jgi:hypothetical protein